MAYYDHLRPDLPEGVPRRRGGDFAGAIIGGIHNILAGRMGGLEINVE
jgi:hypothetical protein